MSDYRIVMQKRQVALVLADGSRLEGEVFLNLYEAHHIGPQRLGDLLNSDIRFLPVQTASGIQLVNVERIVSAQTGGSEEADELMRLGEKHRIRITTLLRDEIVADLYVNLPEISNRVKDGLNRAQRFLPLFLEEDVLYLNTSYILLVQD
jgi:hypothetical protein